VSIYGTYFTQNNLSSLDAIRAGFSLLLLGLVHALLGSEGMQTMMRCFHSIQYGFHSPSLIFSLKCECVDSNTRNLIV
jgi:hypothetical protein